MKLFFCCLSLTISISLFAVPPSAPSGLTASGTSAGVQLSWKDTSNGRSAFLVQAQFSPGEPFNSVASVTPGTLKYLWSPPFKNFVYRFRVLAKTNDLFNEISSPSNTVELCDYSVPSSNPSAAARMCLPFTPIDESRSVARWDIVEDSVQISYKVSPDILKNYTGMPMEIRSEIEGLPTISIGMTMVPTDSPNLRMGTSMNLSASDMNTLLGGSLSGVINWSITLTVTLPNKTKISAGSYKGQVRIERKTDNQQYRIAVVRVLPTGMNLSKFNFCLAHASSNPGPGFQGFGVAENCCTLVPSECNKPNLKSIPLENLLFGGQKSTSVANFTTLQRTNVPAGNIEVYSLSYLASYWRDLLTKHQITDTIKLKKNPQFQLRFQSVINAPMTLPASALHSDVKDYFATQVKAAGLNLTPYHFVVYMMLLPTGSVGGFDRAFASGRDSYSPIRLDSTLIGNAGFLTVAHEMGHQIFLLPDRYEGFGIKHPSGVPKPNSYPQLTSCLMAKGFGLSQVASDRANAYQTFGPREPWMNNNQIETFHTQNPGNTQLCVGDIAKISGENPACTEEDYNLGRCGSKCSPNNYLKCSR